MSASCSLLFFTVVGTSMVPLIAPDDVLSVRPKHCVESVFEKKDIVLFKNGIDKNPLVKRIYATSGDVLSVQAPYVYVNGKKVKNSEKKVYRFTEKQLSLLKLYVGELKPHTYFVLGDLLSGSHDSLKFGLIHYDDIMGRIESVNKKYNP